MQSISRKSFEEKEQSMLINDVEYVIPKRSQAIQEKLKALKSTKSMSEFDEYFGIVEILLGKKNATEIFSNGKNENLDYMAMVVVAALEVYNATKVKFDNQKLEEAMESITPTLDKILPVADLMKNGI